MARMPLVLAERGTLEQSYLHIMGGARSTRARLRLNGPLPKKVPQNRGTQFATPLAADLINPSMASRSLRPCSRNSASRRAGVGG